MVEYHGCDPAVLDDADLLREVMEAAALNANASIVQTVVHRFTPQGASVVVVIEESHLSIHTWPEVGYAAVDFYTCGECDPILAHEVLVERLRATDSEIVVLHRGLQTEATSVMLVEKRIEHADGEVFESNKTAAGRAS